jgi:hypothetical protein
MLRPIPAAAALLALLCAVAGYAAAPAALPAPDDPDVQTSERSAPAPVWHAGAVGEEYLLDGEYGLWVREVGRDLEVHWVTRGTGEGALEAYAGERLVHRSLTPAAKSHRVVVPRPRGSTLLLRYGAVDDPLDRHETMLYLDAASRRSGASFTNVDSVFVVGDVHGEFDTLIALLRNAGVIDQNLRWSAGRAHLVLLGDLFDRGADVTRLLWFVYGLEPQAQHARGRVHVVLGNHEIMVMLDDLRYVGPKEMLISHLHGTSYSRMYDPRQSLLGRWLATKPAVLRINDVLYAHGGVTDDYVGVSLRAYDDALAAFMREDLFYHWTDSTAALRVTAEQVRTMEEFFWGERSAFWFRGYVRSDTLTRSLSRVLRHFRTSLHVVAHTPVRSIEERYAGSLIAVNTTPPATELLFLVRDGRRGTTRLRWPMSGPPVPLPPGATALSPARPPVTDHGHADP